MWFRDMFSNEYGVALAAFSVDLYDLSRWEMVLPRSEAQPLIAGRSVGR